MDVETASSISIGPGTNVAGWGSCPMMSGVLIFKDVEKGYRIRGWARKEQERWPEYREVRPLKQVLVGWRKDFGILLIDVRLNREMARGDEKAAAD